MSIGSDVLMPWPTSGFLAMIVTTPSGVILMNALGVKRGWRGACANSSATASSCVAISRPPPASADTRRKLRRVTVVVVAMAYSSPFAAAGLGRRARRRDRRGAVDRLADADIRAAPAHVAVHRLIDVGVGRLRLLLQQRRRRHDLPGLAVAALGDVDLLPRLLHGMRAVGRQSLDRRDRAR